jgi:hypothetical protein
MAMLEKFSEYGENSSGPNSPVTRLLGISIKNLIELLL